MLRHNAWEEGGGPSGARESGTGSSPGPGPGGGRLNMLLTDAGWEPESWADVLPRLLEPMGVVAFRAQSGAEATRLLRSMPVHIAVVDLSLPLEVGSPAGEAEGGRRLLELLARLDSPPPTVVVNPRRARREVERHLMSALQAGVFAVLERPVGLETALEVFRRVLHRHYSGGWPKGTG